ncbi:MAG: PAS domain S-box protein [Vicinamibacteria bacterium]|nr:PAS domain S-box protein [Vicinamibacteria bacterium]
MANPSLAASDPRESRLLESLFEAAPDSILVVDESGSIIDANPQASRSFGYAVSEMIGQRIEMLVPEVKRPGHARLREAYQSEPLRRPMGRGLDLEARRRDGSTFPVDIMLGPFETEAGRFVTAIVRDVTERRAVERDAARKAAALEEVKSELEAFAYSVSHDLRTPLRAMQGIGLALEEDFSSQLEPQALDYVRRIVAAAKRMDALILDLLAYSRVGRGQSAPRVVDLDAVWAPVRDEFVASHQAVVTLHMPLGYVRGNPSLVAQIATNLMANAVKFVAKGQRPEVEIRSRASNGRVRVSVTDNGIGIDPAHHGRIFGIFERLHGIEQYPGTGIGLALVKKAAEGMNGAVGVESRLGAGSSFWFELEEGEVA